MSHSIRIATALVLVLAPASALAGELRGRVEIVPRAVGSKNPTPDQVLVFLEDAPEGGPKPRGPFAIVQRGKSFSPSVLVVPKGATVSFPNEDAVAHNVFSVTPGAAFDLGLYAAGSSKTATFDQPGIVAVYCNIHPQMVAYVVVAPNPFHVFAEPDGRFSFGGLPPGRYHLVAWFRHGAPVRQEVTVPAEGGGEVRIVVRERADAGRHDTKSGAPYGRY